MAEGAARSRVAGDGADPGERARLTRASIVEAGLALAAEPNRSSISVRDLGTRIGADPTAVYRHFRNKDEILAALLDALFARTAAAAEAAGGDWRERLRVHVRSSLDAAREHPAVGRELMRLSTDGPGEMAVVDLILGAFEEAGLDGDALVDHYARYAFLVLAGTAGIVSAGGSDGDEWFGTLSGVTAASHPRVHRVRDRLRSLSGPEILLAGVESIIESAEQAVAD